MKPKAGQSWQACPKCGDDRKGYFYSVLAYDRRGGAWGESSESSAVEQVKEWPKTVRCAACGARVNREAAGDLMGKVRE